MKLIGWQYDSGEPYYMETISQWSVRQQPRWCCSAWTDDGRPSQQIDDWLQQNALTNGDWETHWRFNSGNPFLQIMIFDDNLAMAFRLRWADHFAERL